MFLIITLGYLLGSVKIGGLQLGTSGVLLVALIFGHYGYEIPQIIRDFGLACFVAAVGFIAGPAFFRGFRKQALAYVVLGIVIVITGALVAVAAIKLGYTTVSLGVGILSGALTSTPGLAAAIEASKDTLASIGYGIAYPFGVVGVVLFVQLLPKLERVDIAVEVAELTREQEAAVGELTNTSQHLKVLEPTGLLPLAAALVVGLWLATPKIPLPGGASFNLGISGGPLLAGLLFGHFGQVGNISLRVPAKTLEIMRELGLILFLCGAGVGAGRGFVAIIQQQGMGLFLVGALETILPMLVGYTVARKIFKLSLLNSLGSICGGMTSTPALGALITTAQSDRVAASYAATYPVALITVVLCCQFIALFM